MKLIIALILFLSLPLMADPLTIWTSSENVKNAIMQSVSSFEKDYQVKVEVTVLNKDLTSQFKTAALANKGPDILVWAHDVIGDLAESGLVEAISIPKNLKQAFLPVALQAFTYKKKIYGYPYDLESIALIYNKKLVKTLPNSMEELVAEAQKIKTETTYGLLYDYRNFFFSFPLLTAGGGYIFKNENDYLNIQDIGLDNAGAVAGAEFILKFVKSGLIPESTDRSIAFNKMKEGNLAFTIDGPWAINELKMNSIDYGIAPLPKLNGQTPRPFVGCHGFIIRRSSNNKELAKEFIENFLVSKEGILRLYKADPRGPSRADAVEELSKTDGDLRQFMESAKNGIPMPNVPEMSAVWNAVGSALALIASGNTTPQTALTQAKEQIIASIKK